MQRAWNAHAFATFAHSHAIMIIVQSVRYTVLQGYALADEQVFEYSPPDEDQGVTPTHPRFLPHHHQCGIETNKTNMALHANAAMAALKLNCFVQAIEHCDKVSF